MILRGEVSVAHASSALYFSCIDVKFVTETQDQPFFFFGHSELTLVSPTVTFPLQENAHV